MWGPGFDGKGVASRTPSSLAVSGRGGGRPTQTEQVTDIDMDGYTQRQRKHEVQLQALAPKLQRQVCREGKGGEFREEGGSA